MGFVRQRRIFLKIMDVKFRYLLLAIFCLALANVARAQDSPPVEQVPTDKSAPAPKDNTASPPRSDNVPAGESSSTQTRIGVSPPKDDTKLHPESGLDTGVDEFTPYNPMKAMKAVEVGDYYFKRKNYKGALERYKDALVYKPNDAVANFRLAECEEKIGNSADATQYYEAYLKILPDGPFASDAQKALDRLKSKAAR